MQTTEHQAFDAWSSLFKHPELALPACFSLLPSFINCLRTPLLLLQRERPSFGKKAISELLVIAIDDPAITFVHTIYFSLVLASLTISLITEKPLRIRPMWAALKLLP